MPVFLAETSTLFPYGSGQGAHEMFLTLIPAGTFVLFYSETGKLFLSICSERVFPAGTLGQISRDSGKTV